MLKKRLGVEAIERDWCQFIFNYYKIPSTLVIPEGCEKIGISTFSGYCKLRSVVIPESVRKIDDDAFWGCYRLEEVVIPKSVEEIGYTAFADCKSATIILEKPKKDFKFIGLEAFECCRNVKEKIRY